VNTIRDWTSDDRRYRHFYFDVQCDDTSEAVLGHVEDCMNRLGDIAQYTVMVRCPLTIIRYKEFETDKKLAIVRMRVAIDLTSKVEFDGLLLGLGEETEVVAPKVSKIPTLAPA